MVYHTRTQNPNKFNNMTEKEANMEDRRAEGDWKERPRLMPLLELLNSAVSVCSFLELPTCLFGLSQFELYFCYFQLRVLTNIKNIIQT